MSRIKPLSAELVNQIAAGEVIERPASVVKELLENSLDAGARCLTVEIQQGGSKLIRITDDGMGIHPDDLSLAVTSHATSKLSDAKALLTVGSLGFRGEALASIASISRFRLQSKSNQSDQAWEIALSGCQSEITPRPTSLMQGTRIEVCDLFFNTPVRRKFLASEKTERQQIESVIKRIALSQFNLQFQVQFGQKSWKIPVGDAKLRLQQLLGKRFVDLAKPIEALADSMKLTGWVLPADETRSQTDWQYVFLNGRFIRDKLVTHAIRSAFSDQIHPGRHSAYLLYLTVSPEAVDVNVHPTKQEVRFVFARQVHDFIASALRRVLITNPTTSPPNLPAHGMNSTRLTSPPKSSAVENIFALDELMMVNLNQQFFLVDLRAALAEIYLTRLTQSTIKSRPILVPVALPMEKKTVGFLSKHAVLLAEFGIQFSQLGESQILLRQLPTCLPDLNCLVLFSELSLMTEPLTREAFIVQVAQHAAQETVLTTERRQEIYDLLLKARLPAMNQLNQPIYRELTKSGLHKLLMA